MSTQLRTRLARRLPSIAHSRRYLHHPTFPTSNLRPSLLSSNPRYALRTRWPHGLNHIHNLPAVRSVSFARIIPSIAVKLVRVPAMIGGSVVAGGAYVSYQLGQAGNYVGDVLKQGGEFAVKGAGDVMDGAQGIAGRVGEGWERAKDEFEHVRAPDWLKELFEKREGGESGGGGGGPPPPGPGPQVRSSAGGAVAAAGTGAAFGYTQSEKEDERSGEQVARDDQMMVLTSKML